MYKLLTILAILGGLLLGYLTLLSLIFAGWFITIIWLVVFYLVYIKLVDWWFDGR